MQELCLLIAKWFWRAGGYGERRRLAVTGLFTKKPLAVKSDRRDPTNKFRRYRGGYDVTSKHYWAVGHLPLPASGFVGAGQS